MRTDVDLRVMDENEPVIIPAIMLSDHVIREAGTNKLSLIGVFNMWNCPKFPFQAPRFWVTIFLTNFRVGNSAFNVTARIETRTSGHVLASLTGKVSFPDATIPAGAMVEIPLPVENVFFPEAGVYRVVVLVDDDKIQERTFVVNSITATGPAQLQ